MLVLSRRINEDVLFPNSGIRLRILHLKGNMVRVGIEAPPEVEILRGELAPAQSSPNSSSGKADRHHLRNQLNRVTLGLHYFQQQWQAGLMTDANDTLSRVLEVLDTIDRDLPPARGCGEEVAPQKPKSCRTLLVEDDANERELLAGILSMNGCECETVADGQDALNYLASHEPPDLVLLDMGLPRLSGGELLRHIRRDPRSRNLKVFAVSGSSPKELGIVTGPDGVDAWFSKPINPGRLWEAIQGEVVSVSRVN